MVAGPPMHSTARSSSNRMASLLSIPSSTSQLLLCNTRYECKNTNGKKVNIICQNVIPPPNWNVQGFPRKAIVSVLVATLVINNGHQAFAERYHNGGNNLCQIATIPSDTILRLDGTSDGEIPFIMGGMSAKNFNPARYAGRWFEVASLKRGFAGQGQEDCHCTQGVYTFEKDKKAIEVDTFCAHGSPDGYITGIRGVVKCVEEADLSMAETDEERQEMIASKCFLKFPYLPFIPKEPYDVIDTDYDNFALVSGAKDKSFVQIYSRTPNPGPEFIEKYKTYLGSIGFNVKQIKDTPQDCEETSMGQLQAMMAMPGMQEALNNRFPDLQLKRPIQLDPLTSVFDTFRKLLELYFK